jgi:hypothetical protein
MKGKNPQKERISIYVQAAIALMFIQFIHKIVREIPGSLNMGGPGGYVTILLAFLLFVGIVLSLFRIKWGLIFGFIDGAWMIFQPVLVHIIWAKPDINGIWWYPIFPWTQALLLIYFCTLAWKKANWK